MDDVMNLDKLYDSEGLDGVPEFDNNENFEEAFKDEL